MNKAFVREPDAVEARCPKCGTPGIVVPEQVLTTFMVPASLSEIAKTAYFCDFPRCDVAYFDDFERFVEAAALRVPVWPKDPDAPLCGCFGLTADDVRSDVVEGGVQRVRAIVERSKTSEARCAECSPTGRSCAAVVQRYYFHLKGGGAT